MPGPSQQSPASPLPNLQVQPGSGLSFPWSIYQKGILGSSEAVLAADGVQTGLVIWMNWEDAMGSGWAPPTPLGQLLGYSKRVSNVNSSGLPGISRILPWQHPEWNQLFVKRIASIRGVQMGPKLGILQPGEFKPITSAPRISFKLALVTLEFWRPPYYLRTDAEVGSIDAGAGNYPHEWLRYLDRNWEISSQMITRPGQVFTWRNASLKSQAGQVAQVLGKVRMKRRWYEVPDAALFSAATDGTPTGLPTNLLYTQTLTENPITYTDPGGPYQYPAGKSITCTVNTTTDATVGVQPVDTSNNRFLGCPMGTLLYLGAELVPRPLQLPAWMMEITKFGSANEPLTQIQYDVVFNFLFFDPPTTTETFRGHNLMPYSGNGFWYSIRSVQDTTLGTAGPFVTPIHFAQFKDLFQTL